MPRARSSGAAAKQNELENKIEAEKPADSDERVDLDVDNDLEETIEEEEVEYEEVEEEVEEEEEEEEVEEEVEEEEEEEVEEDSDVAKGEEGDEEMKDSDEEEKKHAELLSLPPHGSEVYLGGLPVKASEADVRSFCESIGEVTEVRLMKERDSGESKGYGFVTFRTKDLASKAIKELNNKELKGKKVKCSTSQAKNKLFIGNIPKSWGENDIKKVVSKIGPGVSNIELLKDPQNSDRNRGFVFVEYYNHACAEYSREKMSKPKFKIEGKAPTVSWADPKNAESSASSQVKAIYIKNLPKNITDDKLKEVFEHHGEITKVVLPPAKPGHEKSRYGFIHFAERSSAMKAVKDTEKYEIDGQKVECSLAKPQTDQKASGGSSSQKSALLPSYPPRLGYGLAGSAYGAGFAQPMMYGRGAAPGSMAMMPMLLPDGRIGYVLQQPGMPHTPPPQQRGGRSGGGRGGSSSSGRRGNDSGRGRSRYNPY